MNIFEEKHYKGRTKIEIPANEINEETIREFLPNIMSIFRENKLEIDYLVDYLEGEQDIYNKVKEVRETINNKKVENHAFEIVEFIKGYLVGNPIQYSQRITTALVEDITYLNTYMVDQEKGKKDTQMIEWIATCGKALYLTLPNPDTIDNVEKESPFKEYLIDPREGDVIYSSTLNKEKIGCFVITEIPKNANGEKYLITIYGKNKKYEIYSKGAIPTRSMRIVEKEFIVPYVPMTEYYFFESRMGLIEIVKDSLDLLNQINSNEMDDIEQFVNNIMVLINQDIKEEDVKLLRENKLLKLKSPNPQMQADVKFLQQALEHGDIDVFYNRVYEKMMGIVAIPRSGDVATSGGDTGQARLLGTGWTLADQRAMTYQNMLSASERENLKVVLWICRTTTDCPIKELYPSEIDVKFNINRSDNMLVKAQTMSYLKQLELPTSIIAEKSQFFNDPLEVSKEWDKQIEKNKKEAEQKQQNNNNNKTTEVVIENQDNRTK